MKNKTFLWVLGILVGVCLILTVAHLAYAADAYSRASIIQFVAKELW
ncbi:MAG: hypothetical protein IKZ21_05295 [Clostridia bacterium]|nr:hypothetical protein [Clostridia bacterium]